MDVEILSRIQFAFTVSFHYIFPTLSIGLGVFLVIVQVFWLKTRDPVYHNMARYWTRVFGLIFAIGVATGIVLEFEFGTNWATYSRFVGDVFGSPLAIEGLYAFFLESGFLAVLLFGWDKVGPYTHFFATLMVCLGSHFSAVWIVVANSWMQTPAGFNLARRVKTTVDGTHHSMAAELPEGSFIIEEIPLPIDYILQPEDLYTVRAVISDFGEMVFNPSSVDRLIHVIIGCWLAGAFLVISISAYYILKRRHLEFARRSMKIAMAFAAVAACLQLVSADSTARGVAKNQPVKLAAIEGLWETEAWAPLGLAGFVTYERDDEGRIIGGQTKDIRIPGLLSLLVSGDYINPVRGMETTVPGLLDLPSDEFLQQRYPDATPEELKTIRPNYWPIVPAVYQFYHIMIAIGMALIAISLIGLFLWWKGWLFEPDKKWIRYFLGILVISVLLPQIANQAGWYTAEMGRQPWVVYEILKTSEGLSQAVQAHQVLRSIIMFFLIYSLLFFVFIYTLHRKIMHGPRDDESIEVLPERWRRLVKIGKHRAVSAAAGKEDKP